MYKNYNSDTYSRPKSDTVKTLYRSVLFFQFTIFIALKWNNTIQITV